MPLPGDLPDTGNEPASFLSPTLANGYHWCHLGSPIIYSHRVYLIYISKFCVLHRSPLSYFSSSSSLTWYFTVTLQSVPLFTFKYNLNLPSSSLTIASYLLPCPRSLLGIACLLVLFICLEFPECCVPFDKLCCYAMFPLLGLLCIHNLLAGFLITLQDSALMSPFSEIFPCTLGKNTVSFLCILTVLQ